MMKAALIRLSLEMKLLLGSRNRLGLLKGRLKSKDFLFALYLMVPKFIRKQ